MPIEGAGHRPLPGEPLWSEPPPSSPAAVGPAGLERGVVGFVVAVAIGTPLGFLARVRWVILPAALPAYLAGLRQGSAFSWRSLAAEIIVVGGTIGFGLGSLLQQGRELQAMSTVIAAILLILGVGILAALVFLAPLERRLPRLRGPRPETAR